MFFHRRQTKISRCKDSASPPCTATTVSALPALVAEKPPRQNERPSSLPRQVPPAASVACHPLPPKTYPLPRRPNRCATPHSASAPPICTPHPASRSQTDAGSPPVRSSSATLLSRYPNLCRQESDSSPPT